MKKIIFILLIVPLFSFNLHKIHVSLTNIIYKPKSKILQITTRVFIDDLENVFRKNYDNSVELNTDREPKNIDELFKKYFKEHLKIKLDSKPISLKFLGKEYDQDIVYIYFEMEDIPAFKTMEITNTSLFEIFEDQKNIVKIKINNSQKTFFLKSNHFKETLTLE